MERTTIELFKKPDLNLLRNLKASLTLTFNTDVSYRDAILYLFASRVLGTKSVNTFINQLIFRGDISEILNQLIDFINGDPSVRAMRLSELRDERLKSNQDYISYCESFSDEALINIKKEIADVKRREKEFLEVLKKIEKAEIDVLWKVK